MNHVFINLLDILIIMYVGSPKHLCVYGWIGSY